MACLPILHLAQDSLFLLNDSSFGEPIMYLIQILLPLYDNGGNRFSPRLYDTIRSELTDRFGGLTAFIRSPATGLWKEDRQTIHDEIVIYEVMTGSIDYAWWDRYREDLRTLFQQHELIIRATVMELL
jgi:hypothetical protein